MRMPCDYRLHDKINIAGLIWNHVTALQRRYYRLTGKYIPTTQMQSHIAKLRKRTKRFAHWRLLGSQCVQDVCQRHDKAYKRFFKKQSGRPNFRKVKKYRSFTLKQSGYKLYDPVEGKKHRKIKIDDTVYKFVYHRELKGKIKTVTVKRDSLNQLWICFSVVEKITIPDEASTDKIGGFDFGLRHFLTTDEGDRVDAPQFYRDDLPSLRQVQRAVSKKKPGSQNEIAGKRHIARRHIRIADKRRDFHYQLTHALCDHYDTLVFEDLNIDGMKRLWGRKVSDLGFSQFMNVMKWVALKRGKQVIQIDRWERTTGLCSCCGHRQTLGLAERTFKCKNCELQMDRDHNAAHNILAAGHRRLLSQSEEDQSEASDGIRR